MEGVIYMDAHMVQSIDEALQFKDVHDTLVLQYPYYHNLPHIKRIVYARLGQPNTMLPNEWRYDGLRIVFAVVNQHTDHSTEYPDECKFLVETVETHIRPIYEEESC